MAEYATARSLETGMKSQVPDPHVRFGDAVWAYTILRLSFGANIMLHGVARLIAGHAAFLAYLTDYFAQHSRRSIFPAAHLCQDFAFGGDWTGSIAGSGIGDAFCINCRRPGYNGVSYLDKPGARFDGCWTPIDLRFYLLLLAGSSRQEPGIAG